MADICEQIEVTDYEQARKIQAHVSIGHYFIFADNQEVAGEPSRSVARKERLHLTDHHAAGLVMPLTDSPVQLAGLTVNPPKRAIAPVGCLVTDRDLYRVEQDTVHLFVACPQPPAALHLLVEYNGEPFTEMELELVDGVGIETLPMLLSGSYRARLTSEGREIGAPVSFTVAEYTLAPLSARLLSHRLERTGDELTFNIGVESYQMPYTGSLRVALVDGDHEVYQTELSPEMAGKYGGQVPLSGDGPFRLRLIAVDDGEKVAEVVIPGSRARERKATVISELGREMLFSMMPEPEALPVRGGYLSKGDHFASPLTVSEILTDRRTIHATTDVESLSLVVLDLATGRITIQTVGTVHAGEEVTVTAAGPMCTVIAGCFIGDRPFEGYTTFMAPPRLQLEIETAETILPRQELMVRLTCKGANHKVPVLLSIRDQRLTVTDTPHTGLGASLKRAVEVATEGMAERGFTSLADVLDQGPLLEDVVFSADFEAGALSLGSDEVGEYLEDLDTGGDFEDLELAVLEESVGGADEGTTDSGMEEPAREAFPEQLFYGIVPVRGREEVVIPLGDLLGIYTVEAFALASGEWASADTSVIVDQPVRVDMELPPAVHPEDLVTGRLRAATGSGKGTVVLTRDGQNVSLRDTGGREIIAGEDLETPMELEFDLAPGTYLARIEDAASGETDSMQSTVEVPGQFRSYAREMGLLQVGESINLDAADALSLRVIPVVDEPFDALLTTTAGYAHLCCEQTAAKILAAVFMYLTAGSAGVKSKAEEIILAGIARERKMLWPGKGFRMYPDSNYSSDYYGPLAVRYLWYLERLDRVPNISVNLRKVALEGVTMADNAAKSYRMERIPQRLTSMEEAYAAAVNGGDAAEIKAIIESRVDLTQDQARVRNKTHMVADRALLAYTAATLLTLGEWKTGIEIANQVTRQFNEQGRMYSTVDSVAAIVLIIQLMTSRIITGAGRVRVNGREMSSTEAAALSDQVETIEVLEGVVPIEVTCIREEDWNRSASVFPVKIGFRDEQDRLKREFRMGERAELLVTLPDGYQLGDLLHVNLPASLSWIRGGGKVKRFTLDFEGRDELRVPLVVTSAINNQQHFAVCVRNMFEEERTASPGLLTVS